LSADRKPLPEPGDVPHEGITAAWRRATRMKHRKRGDSFVVGIAEGRSLLARGTLDSFERLSHFARSMSELGFAASFEDDDAPSGRLNCDVVFRRVEAPGTSARAA